jgi:hypothetical protein
MPAKAKSSKKSIDTKQTKEIKELKSQVDYFKNQMANSSNSELEKNVEELNEQITKLVSININLQSKMTELLIKMTDLVRENRELIGLLEEAGDEDKTEKSNSIGNDSILFELKKIEKNTSDSLKINYDLNSFMKKMYTKNLLSKAINGKIEEMEMPMPSEGMKTDEL